MFNFSNPTAHVTLHSALPLTLSPGPFTRMPRPSTSEWNVTHRGGDPPRPRAGLHHQMGRLRPPQEDHCHSLRPHDDGGSWRAARHPSLSHCLASSAARHAALPAPCSGRQGPSCPSPLPRTPGPRSSTPTRPSTPSGWGKRRRDAGTDTDNETDRHRQTQTLTVLGAFSPVVHSEILDAKI